MPPKRAANRERASNENPPAQSPAALHPSEDIKPAVDQLNAAASSDAELRSNPLDPSQPDPISLNTTPAHSARSTPSIQQVDTPSRATPSSTRARRGAPRGGVRRSQAQREELQKADDERRRVEAQQRAQTDAAKAKQQGRYGGDRGRGRGDFRGRGRGRGGYMGEADKRNKEAVASGPFSGGRITKEQQSSGKWRTSGGISRGSQRGYGPGGRSASQQQGEAENAESGTFTTGIAPPKQKTRTTYSTAGAPRARAAEDGTPVKPDPESKPPLDADGDISMSGPIDGGYISSDEEFEAKQNAGRFNIEDLIDLTNEDPQYDNMAPVRVMRVAHKERTMGINADGATTKDGAIAVGANDAATTGKGKGKTRQKAKEEPQTFELSSGSDRETEPAPDATTIKPDPEAPSAAEEIVGGPPPADEDPNLDDLPNEPPSSPESKRKAKDKIKTRTLSSSQPDRPDLQTQEEIDEWERNQADLRLVHDELGTPAPTAAAEGEDQPTDPRADKVYLFQFPPVLPDLEPMPIKPDPDAPHTTTTTSTLTNAHNGKDHPIDLSTATAAPRLPSGLVGKLKIHASGRATLDWGGTSFCLGMGGHASFLQDILVARVPGEGKIGVDAGDVGMNGEDKDGVAMSMGQVKGKFVVTPDWDRILG